MKSTKKLVSLILAVMMVVTMIPMNAFAATTNSADDANAKALLAQLDAYEAKMDGKHFYTNMTAAYSAYMMANRAYAGYTYGDVQGVDLVSYTNNLKNAIAAMGTWTQPTITTKQSTWANDGKSSGWATEAVHSNLAYVGAAAQVFSTNKVVSPGTSTATDTSLAIANPADTVMIYDGKTIPAVPVMAVLTGTSGKDRMFYAIEITDNDSNSLYLEDAWIGKANSGNNFDYSYQRWDSSAGQKRVGTKINDTTYAAQVSKKGTGWFGSGSWANPEGDTNVIRYNKDFSTGTYIKTITPTFTGFAGSTTSPTNTDIVLQGNGNAIQVINYKAIPDALTNNISKLNLQGRKYAAGGATDLIKAFDAATTFTVDSYFTSGNNATGCANAIKTIVDNLNNGAKTADLPEYLELRAAVKDTMSTYNSPSYTDYTAESWKAFTDAYEAVQAEYARVYNDGFRTNSSYAASIKALADNLLAAKAGLVVNVAKADTFILENTLDDALVAISNYKSFTSSSYNSAGLVAKVKNAQEAVWGSVEFYKDDASKVGEDKQAIVDEWVVTVGEAIALLEINKGTTVGTAYGYSLNSALAEAKAKDPSAYTNYADLEKEIAKAEKFDVKVISDTTHNEDFRTGIVQAKINEYEALVEGLATALVNLRVAFSNIADGTIAHTETGLASVRDFGANHSDGKYYTVNYSYPNETVIFKTKHDPAKIALPAGSIQFSMRSGTEGKLGASYLDTININSAWSGEDAEITSAYDGGNATLNSDRKATHVGGLTIAKDGYIYSVGNSSTAVAGAGIYGSKMSTGWSHFGLDSSGNEVDTSAYDFTNDLMNVAPNEINNVNNPAAGSLGSRDSAVVATASISLSMPSSIAKTLTADTKCSVKTLTLADNANLAALVEYKYPGAANRVYYGYTAKSQTYSQTLYVVDIANFIDLIAECDALKTANYTTSSWNAFKTALQNAKAEMNYGEMSAQAISDECNNRYDALWAARAALVEAASNDIIDNALTVAATYKNNGKTYTTSTLAAFNEAYTNAVNAINGAYSDDKCLDIAKSTAQASIDVIANALTNAIAALAEVADFTTINDALSVLSTKTTDADGKYSVETLQALKTVVDSAVYASYTAEQKADTPATAQTSIDDEAAAIVEKVDALAAVDATALIDAKKTLESMKLDPDHYDVAGAEAIIDGALDGATVPVEIRGVEIQGVNKTQTDIDNSVREALEEVAVSEITYTVYVNGDVYKTYKYGEEAEVTFDENSDIFYAYKSRTYENSEKFYTTDSVIHFVVKGDTYLRAVPVVNDSETKHKVTFVSGLNNKVIEIKYVADGEAVTVPAAPNFPYHSFTGYTLDGAAYAGAAVTEDVTVIANYTADTETFTIVARDTEYEDTTTVVKYNELVTLECEGAYAWAKFEDEDALEMWTDGEIESDAPIYTIVGYGDTYSFYAFEDAYYGAITMGGEYDVNYDASMGYVDLSTVGKASVVTAQTYLDADTKISFVSSYAMDEDKYELVESGLLVAKVPNVDLRDITQTEVDGNKVYRLKSSQHTVGNQFVISLSTKNMPSPQNFTIVAYLIYKDKATGEFNTVYGNNEQIVYTK